MTPDAVPLYNPNDNLTGRDGGPYLDEVEARNAEARRAVVEEREPDFDNPPAPAGIPLVSAGRLAGLAGVNNLPSQSARYDASNAGLVSYRAEDDDEPNFTSRGEIPAEFFDVDEETEADSSQDDESDDAEFEDSEDQVEPNSHDPNSPTTDNTASDKVDGDSQAEPEELNFDGFNGGTPEGE